MNVVRISDGLGNQMFQYAFARRLQIDTGKPVSLDIRYINNEDIFYNREDNFQLKKNDYRRFGLDHFKVRLNIADEKELRHWKYLCHNGMGHKGISALAQKGLWPWGFCNEACDEAAAKGRHFPVYYKGYFFHLKYYDDVKEILQKEFVLKNKLHLPGELKEILKENQTIAIHVRRGDFLKWNRDLSQKDYYPRAVKLMSEKIEKPVYLVFSDDIKWVKENIKTDARTIYVSEMGFEDYEELAIMKHCQHYIIANSTFSYWAAYLSRNANKTVICPKHWKSDIIPEDWIKL